MGACSWMHRESHHFLSHSLLKYTLTPFSIYIVVWDTYWRASLASPLCTHRQLCAPRPLWRSLVLSWQLHFLHCMWSDSHSVHEGHYQYSYTAQDFDPKISSRSYLDNNTFFVDMREQKYIINLDLFIHSSGPGIVVDLAVSLTKLAVCGIKLYPYHFFWFCSHIESIAVISC